MTDKELRKLSRLELLELLLEASKENQKLKDQVETLKADNTTAQNIKNLSEMTLQVENALRYANSLTNTLKVTSSKSCSDKRENTNANKQNAVSDKDIYCRMMVFLAKTPEALQAFPDELKTDIAERIRDVFKKISK